MKRLVFSIFGLSLTLLVASSGYAVQLTGGFGSVGNFIPNAGLVAATAIDFIACNGATCVPPPITPTATPGVAGQFLVTSATGSFGSGAGNVGLVPNTTIGDIKDLTFSPTVPINAFQVVTGAGTLTFDLTSLSIVAQNATCNAGNPCISLSGTGTFHATGFDDTPGTWTFMGVQACPGLTNCGNPPFIETFQFTSANNSTPVTVPEPSVLVLIGMGLVGLAAWGRVKMRNTK